MQRYMTFVTCLFRIVSLFPTLPLIYSTTLYFIDPLLQSHTIMPFGRIFYCKIDYSSFLGRLSFAFSKEGRWEV